MAKVSIIILNWNGLSHLSECLPSIERQTYQNFECIMVDNGSTDASVAFVENNYPWVKLVCLKNNTGFARGNSIGYSDSNGDYIVTLNNDTVVDENWLSELVKTAERCPQIGMVASRICSYGDRDVIDSLGMRICLDGMSRGDYRGKRYSEISDVPSDILLPSGCAALYKRKMIEEIGFFDNSFFAYCEDTDLGLRGRLTGWDACLAKNAIVLHKYSATAGSFSPFKLYLVERNHFWTAFKNFPLILLLVLPVLTAFRYFLQAFLLIKNDGTGRHLRNNSSPVNCIFAFARGVLHGISGGFRFLLKRPATSFLPDKKDFALIRLFLNHRMGFKELLK